MLCYGHGWLLPTNQPTTLQAGDTFEAEVDGIKFIHGWQSFRKVSWRGVTWRGVALEKKICAFEAPHVTLPPPPPKWEQDKE